MADSAVVDSVEYWGERVLNLDGQISALNLQQASLKAQLAFAKRRHRRMVMQAELVPLGPIPALEAAELMATPSDREDNETPAKKDAVALPDSAAKRRRIPAPAGVCKACFREEQSGGKPPGVAHTYLPPCTKERPRKGKGRGKPVCATASGEPEASAPTAEVPPVSEPALGA